MLQTIDDVALYVRLQGAWFESAQICLYNHMAEMLGNKVKSLRIDRRKQHTHHCNRCRRVMSLLEQTEMLEMRS